MSSTRVLTPWPSCCRGAWGAMTDALRTEPANPLISMQLATVHPGSLMHLTAQMVKTKRGTVAMSTLSTTTGSSARFRGPSWATFSQLKWNIPNGKRGKQHSMFPSMTVNTTRRITHPDPILSFVASVSLEHSHGRRIKGCSPMRTPRIGGSLWRTMTDFENGGDDAVPYEHGRGSVRCDETNEYVCLMSVPCRRCPRAMELRISVL